MKTTFIIIGVAVVLSLLAMYIGVTAHNREAKEKGSSEKSYTIWSVFSGFFITVVVLMYEIFREIFWPRRKRLK